MASIPAINPNFPSILPNVDEVTPKAMPLPTSGIEMPSELGRAPETTSVQPSQNSFASMLGQFVADVNSQQAASTQAVGELQGGQNIPLHKAVIAMEEANLSFQLMVEVRNRLLDSYQEIMRMQI